METDFACSNCDSCCTVCDYSNDRVCRCTRSKVCGRLSIPQDKGYFVAELHDGLYWVTEGAYTAMFLTTGKGVVLVDAPPSFGDNMVRAIKEVTDESITHVVYTHSHADHIGGAHLFLKNAVYIAHEVTDSSSPPCPPRLVIAGV